MKSFNGKMAVCLLGMGAAAGWWIVSGASAKSEKDHGGVTPPPFTTQYRRVNLVSDLNGVARFTDPNLVNPWGIAIVPSSGRVWVADNGTGLSTIYSPSGTVQSLVVTVAPPAGSTNTAAPDGLVLDGLGRFHISEGTNSAAALFIFSTEDGTVSGWSPSVDPTNTILMVDQSASNAVFKGLALATDSSSNEFLFVTDFHNGIVEKIDTNFNVVASFTDTSLPAGYAPFGIQNVNGDLYVTFAVQDDEKHDDVAGPGNGFVGVFDVNGNLLRQFAAHGALNSPWGIALAPDGFGEFSGAVLVGNFGDGTINAFATNGTFLGQLTDAWGNVIAIDSLWGLAFNTPPTITVGYGHHTVQVEDIDKLKLYFTAGIGGEGHGLFGIIKPVRHDFRFDGFDGFGHDY
ncbi:MAG TPA: TIGR03118 family protein [Verrucomicrobiae bacterium]|nr:TIGR03118 family protein [Verrucomicrobiae bacterium]